MQDHGLFQAICRVNRLDGEDKDFGYIVDYKDLFKKVENAISVYTSELDHTADGPAPEILLQDRLQRGREQLDNALEALALLCEPVEPPKGELEHIHYFCGNTEIPEELQERESQRSALYKATVALVRAYANISDELDRAAYDADDIQRIKDRIGHYLDVRDIVRRASGEILDLKPYEADMRHLIDTYIEADAPRKISPFDGMGLMELIVETGIANVIATQLGGLKGNKTAIAETIENNVRRTIIKEQLTNPAFFDKMSSLLDELIELRRAKAIEYEEYLKRVAKLAKQVGEGAAEDTPELLKKSKALRAIYDNLQAIPEDRVADITEAYGTCDDPMLELAQAIDERVKVARPDDWRDNNGPKEKAVKAALNEVLESVDDVERIFPIIKAQKDY